MKKRISIVLTFLCIIGASAQSSEKLLNTKVNNLDLKIIKKLQKRDYILSSDSQLLANYVVILAQKNEQIDTLTYRQLIDKFTKYKRNKVIKEYFKFPNFGKDSIFTRTPEREKIFIGLGQLSLEKLIERESKNLPEKYSDTGLNEPFGSPNQSPDALAEILQNQHLTLLFSNTVLVKSELGENISNYRMGDFIEIAKRIMNSDEFKPIIEYWNKK